MDNLLTGLADYPSYVQHLQIPELAAQDLNADVLRLDKLHPIISGNKWFKLKGHLRQALQSPNSPVLTFGGAWSNHLVATAYAAKQLGLPAIGIIRGQRPAVLSTTLEDAIAYGMQLEFISREAYAGKDQSNFLDQLHHRYPVAYIIPEGGAGLPGVLGSEDILKEIDSTKYTHILCAIGTGTTFLGIARAAAAGQLVIGVPVLKGFTTIGENFLTPDQRSRCVLLPNYHFGGYARHPQPLLDFMNRFHQDTGIPSDIVYTGKLFYAFLDSIQQHFFPAFSRILVIHSGGLQGNQSLPPGKLDF